MAIISATANTETDEITVSVNGVDIPNISDVTMYCYLDYEGRPTSCVNVGTTFKDDDSGLVTRTYISKAGLSTLPPEYQRVTAQIREHIK